MFAHIQRYPAYAAILLTIRLGQLGQRTLGTWHLQNSQCSTGDMTLCRTGLFHGPCGNIIAQPANSDAMHADSGVALHDDSCQCAQLQDGGVEVANNSCQQLRRRQARPHQPFPRRGVPRSDAEAAPSLGVDGEHRIDRALR